MAGLGSTITVVLTMISNLEHGPRSRGGGGDGGGGVFPLTDSVLTDSLSLSLVRASFPARVGGIVPCALKT